MDSAVNHYVAHFCAEWHEVAMEVLCPGRRTDVIWLLLLWFVLPSCFLS